MLRRLWHDLVLRLTPQPKPDLHRDVAEAMWSDFGDTMKDAPSPESDEPAMIKLYRRDVTSGALAYHEAWYDDDNQVVIEHFGPVGSKGETIRHRRQSDLTPAQQVEDILSNAGAAGYAELVDDDIKILVVEYGLDGWGGAEDAHKLHALYDKLNEILGWVGAGECDGGAVGSGTMEATCLVADFEAARAAISEGLTDTPFSNFARIYEE